MINAIVNTLCSILRTPGSAVVPTFFDTVNTSQVGNKLSVTLNWLISNEDNLPPSIEDVYLNSTFLVGDTVTAVVRDYFSRSGYAAGSHIHKFYRSIDNKGTSETLVQNSTSPVYTLVSGDNGRFIRCEVTPVQASGLNTTGDPVSSIYSAVSSTAFDLWSTIPWNGAFKLNTSGDLANYGLATNKDSSTVATNGPLTFDGAKTLTKFDRATSQYFSITQGETLTQPLETIVYFRTPTVASGNQVIIGLTNTHRALMTSGRVLQISGVATAQTLALDTEYLLYIKWNGASAVYELGTVTGHTRTGELGVVITAGSINGSPYKIGSDFTPANFWNGWIGAVLTYNNDTGLTSQNKIDIWTAFGF